MTSGVKWFYAAHSAKTITPFFPMHIIMYIFWGDPLAKIRKWIVTTRRIPVFRGTNSLAEER